MEHVRTLQNLSKGDGLVEGLVFSNLKSKVTGKLRPPDTMVLKLIPEFCILDCES